MDRFALTIYPYSFGLSSVLLLSGAIYLLAAPCFLGFSKPARSGRVTP